MSLPTSIWVDYKRENTTKRVFSQNKESPDNLLHQSGRIETMTIIMNSIETLQTIS